MKKVFVLFAAALIALSSVAAELNIYASGLKAHGMRSNKTIKVDYLLNAPATALEIHLLNADNSVALNVPITDAQLLTKGQHVATLDVSSVAVGEYSWEVVASAAANAEVTEVTDAASGLYNFYMPQGIAVDKSFESPYFGRIYVTEGVDGGADGGSDRAKVMTHGVFIYDALLQDVTNQGANGYQGGVKWSADRQGPKRLVVDETGVVFIADNNAGTDDAPATSGIWAMDPQDPKADFKEVLSVKQRKTNYTAISSLDVKGSGAERVIYVLDNVSTSNCGAMKFAVGNYETPYESKGDTIFSGKKHKIVNLDTSIREDGRGGFWVIQHRWSADPYPPLMHIDKNDSCDFFVTEANKADYLPYTANVSYRGAMDLNAGKNLLAVSSNKQVVVFEIGWKDDGAPTLTRLYATPEIGGNVDGIAFDAADNVYAASASTEVFKAFATPKAVNSFATKAPKAQALKVLETVVDVTAVSVEPATSEMWVGDQLTLKATITPDNASDKTVEWSSSDETIALVSQEGVVTALKAGTVEITASASEGEFTAKATLTIKNVDVTEVSLNKAAITLYAGENELLVATIAPQNATNKTVIWTTSDENVAVVSEEGRVSAKAPGTATITATTEDQGKTATCEVTVPVGDYPNIMAYGLKLESENNGITVGFNLNAPATEVKVIAYDADGNDYVVAEKEDAPAEYQTIALNTANLPDGVYTWAVEAEADIVAEDEPVQVRQYATKAFTRVRGVAVDKNPDSPYFGNVYVTDDGATVDQVGMYMYDAKLKGTEDLIAYGADPSTSHTTPMRISVGEDGLVFATDWTDVNPNVYVIDPANPAAAKPIFGGNMSGGIASTESGDFIHGGMSGIYVQGTGENRYLYTFDEDYTPQSLLRYKIGEMTEPYAKKPGVVFYNNPAAYFQNGNSDIWPDLDGGFWISQDRAADPSDGSIPALVHLDKDRTTVNFISKGIMGGRTRGAMAWNEDQTYCITASDNSLRVWAVEKVDDAEAPYRFELEQSIVTTFGAQNSSSCYQIAVDRALNVYTGGNGSSLMVWALIKDENKCETPAPSTATFTIGSVGVDNITDDSTAKTGVYSITGQYLGESVDNLPMGVYVVNGEKVVK